MNDRKMWLILAKGLHALAATIYEGASLLTTDEPEPAELLSTEPRVGNGKPLTARQLEMLAYITAFIAEHGWPPTLREIGAAQGIASTNGVTEHLNAPERKGAIRREDSSSRGIRVLLYPKDGA